MQLYRSYITDLTKCADIFSLRCRNVRSILVADAELSKLATFARLTKRSEHSDEKRGEFHVPMPKVHVHSCCPRAGGRLVTSCDTALCSAHASPSVASRRGAARAGSLVDAEAAALRQTARRRRPAEVAARWWLAGER